MRETEIVEQIRRQALAGFRDRRLVAGIGDDCAVIRPGAREDLVFTTDFSIENRHFTLKTHTPAQMGALALARSLSDLAAMGAEPVFCLVSLAVPSKLNGPFVTKFYTGLMRVARHSRITLAGGDLSRFDNVIADVMCCGRVPRGKALLRSGAKNGHFIYLTGSLGAAAAALRKGKPQLPHPRLQEGLALRKLGVSAAMDLSDGLSLDLARLCAASHVSAELFSSQIPVARGATFEDALHGGEDYELLFTAPRTLKVPIAAKRIGIITKEDIGSVFLDGDPLQSKGFDHFA